MTGLTVTTTTPVISSILDSLQKKIDSSIQSAISAAENAGMNIEIEAGRQVAIAIENAKLAYQDSMEKTLDKVNDTIRNSINALSSMVQDVQDKNDKTLHEIEQKATEWIMALPLAGWQPQLTKVRPKYVVITPTVHQSMVHFNGLFKYAANPKYMPTLELGPTTYKPENTTNQELGFTVNISNGLMDKCAYTVGTLKVPYENGWIWSDVKTSEYKVWLGALPLLPGKINVYYTSTVIDKATKHIVSGTIKAWADKDYPAQWVTKTFTVYPERGWYVIPSSVTGPFVHPGAHGSHSTPAIKSIDPNQIVTEIGLSAIDGKHMGRVEYHVEFDQVQDVVVKHSRQEAITLPWRDSKVIEPQKGEEVSKIAFDAFNGHHYEFAGPDLSNPFLKIRFVNGKYQLSAEVPSDIVDNGIVTLFTPKN